MSPNPEWLTDTGKDSPVPYSLALSAYWVTPGPRSNMKICNTGNGADKSFTQGTQQTRKRSWEKTQVQVRTARKWDLFLKICDSEIMEIKSFSFIAVDYQTVIKKKKKLKATALSIETLLTNNMLKHYLRLSRDWFLSLSYR